MPGVCGRRAASRAVPGEHLFGRKQRVDLVGLPAPAVLATRPLDLDDPDPLGEQKLAQPGAVAAGALDPDHDVILECPQPPE